MEYIIQLEGRDCHFPTAIMIMEKNSYERDIGLIEYGGYLKTVREYPQALKEKLVKMLGEPVRISRESEIFTIRKPFEKCVQMIFDDI